MASPRNSVAVTLYDPRPRRTRRRQWLMRRNDKRERRKRRIAHGGLAFGKAAYAKTLLSAEVKPRALSTNHPVVIELPKRLDFDENYEQTVVHLSNIRLAACGTITLRSLNFRALKFISASAALVLASEIDRWNHQVCLRLRANVKTWHKDIRRLLCQMGLFELLDIPSPSYPAFSKPTVFLPFKRAVVDERDPGKLAKDMRIEIEKTIGVRIKRSPLFDGLSEAITNVSHHAYSGAATFKQWWLSASYDQSTQRLCVTFYDQGDGIPVTLPASKYAFLIPNLLGLKQDSARIEAAMEVGRSSTGDEERGKGLQNLLEFAKAYDGGSLAIYSLRGMYRVDARRNGNKTILEYKKKDFENSIGGTLIEWSVQIPPST